MEQALLGCLFSPPLFFVLILLFGHSERGIALLSRIGSFTVGLTVLWLLVQWVLQGGAPFEHDEWSLYHKAGYEFVIYLFFDHIGAAYLICTWMIFAVIVKYCRYYLHREAGYKRFFLTIFGFVSGLHLVILSGSLDVFYAGWEIVGIASFLLIAFYRHRLQPIRNALRAYSIYRLCDLGLLSAALLIDLLFQQQHRFSEFSLMVQSASGIDDAIWLGLSVLILLASMGKSAQFPFCFWIPRAMEGPTPSSAIFYGALSVHLGVFLLLRTTAVWEHLWLGRGFVFAVGLTTTVIAALSERTQSNIKGRIAYASITQVGIMYIELALGLHTLVLFHMLGNAFVRCYQLLVSPSIVVNLLKVEAETDRPLDLARHHLLRRIPYFVDHPALNRLRNTLEVLSIQEFNLELHVRKVLWDSFKTLGHGLQWLGIRRLFLLGFFIFLIGFFVTGHPYVLSASSAIFLMLMAALYGFTLSRDPIQAWNVIGFSNLMAGIAAGLIGDGEWDYVLLFDGSMFAFWLLGGSVLRSMERLAGFQEPYAYRAMDERMPHLASALFIAFLGVVGFPLWPSFIGQDLMLFHLSDAHPWMTPMVTLSLVLNGISASQIYMRYCAGRPSEVRESKVAKDEPPSLDPMGLD
jgi:NADH:ubiquinone oxidoreductase subunit 5 (subunit L)/multisubunit Na+/H+ antiporter MnhA subunit